VERVCAKDEAARLVVGVVWIRNGTDASLGCGGKEVFGDVIVRSRGRRRDGHRSTLDSVVSGTLGSADVGHGLREVVAEVVLDLVEVWAHDVVFKTGGPLAVDERLRGGDRDGSIDAGASSGKVSANLADVPLGEELGCREVVRPPVAV